MGGYSLLGVCKGALKHQRSLGTPGHTEEGRLVGNEWGQGHEVTSMACFVISKSNPQPGSMAIYGQEAVK